MELYQAKRNFLNYVAKYKRDHHTSEKAMLEASGLHPCVLNMMRNCDDCKFSHIVKLCDTMGCTISDAIKDNVAEESKIIKFRDEPKQIIKFR